MSSGDYQRSIADKITDCAEDVGLALWIVGDLSVILLVAGESKEHDAFDLGLKGCREGLDGAVHDCGTLTRR